jgi:ABC-type nitrate/sulfonate/bicarbonate transport system substrate-binding protein
VNDVVRVGIVTEAFFYIPYWVGVLHGFYAAENLAVEIVNLGGIDQVTDALKRGDIEIGVGSPEHVIHDVELGGPLRMIGGNVNSPTHYLIAQPEIKSLNDLKGRTIGVSSLSGGTSSMFIHLLDQAGLKYPADYTLVVAGAVPPRHTELMERRIDAAMQTDPHNYLAEDAGLSNLGAVSSWIPHFQFVSVNVSLDWAVPNVDQCVRFLAATIRASHWVFENKEEAADLVSQRMGIARKYAVRSWDDHFASKALPIDLRLSFPSIATDLAMMKKDRWSTIKIGDEAEPIKYVDLSYLGKAQQRLGLPIHTADH